MFHSPAVSGLQYVKDLDNSNCFFTGACTKGLQCPGIRVGWVVASKRNIEMMAGVVEKAEKALPARFVKSRLISSLLAPKGKPTYSDRSQPINCISSTPSNHRRSSKTGPVAPGMMGRLM